MEKAIDGESADIGIHWESLTCVHDPPETPMNDKSNVSLLGESDSSVHGELHQGSPCMVNPTSCMKHISPCMNFSVRKRLRSYRNCLRGSEDDDGLLGRQWEAGHCNWMITVCSINRRSLWYPFIWFTQWSIFHVNCKTLIDIGTTSKRPFLSIIHVNIYFLTITLTPNNALHTIFSLMIFFPFIRTHE